MDGNVFRFISRLFGINTPINTNNAKKEFTELLNIQIKSAIPSVFNQAIMEFGALQCVPKNPKCDICPFLTNCFAHHYQKVDQLPIKIAKKASKNRYFYYFVMYHNSSKNKLYFIQRKQSDIWKNLYEFPMIESSKPIKWDEIIENNQISDILNTDIYKLIDKSEVIKHVLTHQNINAQFFEIEISEKPMNNEFKTIDISKNHNLPIHRLVDRYLKEYLRKINKQQVLFDSH